MKCWRMEEETWESLSWDWDKDESLCGMQETFLHHVDLVRPLLWFPATTMLILTGLSLACYELYRQKTKGHVLVVDFNVESQWVWISAIWLESKSGLELTDLPASASQALGSKVCATTATRLSASPFIMMWGHTKIAKRHLSTPQERSPPSGLRWLVPWPQMSQPPEQRMESSKCWAMLAYGLVLWQHKWT